MCQRLRTSSEVHENNLVYFKMIPALKKSEDRICRLPSITFNIVLLKNISKKDDDDDKLLEIKKRKKTIC